MKIIALPDSAEKRAKKCAALRREGIFYSVFVIAAAVLAVLLTLAVLVSVIVFEFKGGLESSLLGILAGSFAGGAVLSALAAFGLNVLGRLRRETELDFRERCDGEESFFVGDGTLATFGENAVVIHGENAAEGDREIRIPYSEMRFFSVCTRRQPREKGVWSVVLEIPARYLAKGGRAKPGEQPALVQADAKPRLYDTLEKRGLSLIGGRAAKDGGKKFAPLAKFSLPDRKKRRNALCFLCVGGLLLVGGVLLGIFWEVAAGALLGTVGILFGARATASFLRAKGVLGVYAEGLYWRDTNRVDSVFLKWEEIERITAEPNDGFPIYRVQCAYGAYHFPAVAGSYAFLKESHPEKMEE